MRSFSPFWEKEFMRSMEDGNTFVEYVLTSTHMTDRLFPLSSSDGCSVSCRLHVAKATVVLFFSVCNPLLLLLFYHSRAAVGGPRTLQRHLRPKPALVHSLQTCWWKSTVFAFSFFWRQFSKIHLQFAWHLDGNIGHIGHTTATAAGRWGNIRRFLQNVCCFKIPYIPFKDFKSFTEA